jgi:ubiquinone/menaquinone biosynthesis C-methylase UbiE
MRRTVIPELLDRDAGSPQEIAASLADLRRINQWFGGQATTLTMLRRILPALPASRLFLLDIGAASGDVALNAQRVLSRAGIQVDVTLLDRCPAHLNSNSQNLNASRRIAADALMLPFADSSFDVVHCALLVHHLEPEQFTIFMQEALRVCRVGVLINDLRRSVISLGLTLAGFPLFRSRLTRHDAPASVRRAYTIGEMKSMLPPSKRIETCPHYLFRMGVIVWK